MPSSLDLLLDTLVLETVRPDVFSAPNELNRTGRLFGGQVVAQALLAAAATVEGLPAHSLHAYFLRPGDPDVPIRFEVDRIRDGRSFRTRRVVAMQGERAIFNLAASFHEPEPSLEHQREAPDVPGPEGLPTWEERAREHINGAPPGVRKWLQTETPLEIRTHQPPSWFAQGPSDEPNAVWLRARQGLGDEGALHQALFGYASDMGFVDNLYRPHAGGPRNVMISSLDHAIWFHRAFRMDDWLLSVQESPVAFGARGLAQAAIYGPDGDRVATVVQEGLLRTLREEAG